MQLRGLPLLLALYPPRDAVGVAEAWEGTKAARASAEAASGELNKKNVLPWDEGWAKSVETELHREE